MYTDYSHTFCLWKYYGPAYLKSEKTFLKSSLATNPINRFPIMQKSKNVILTVLHVVILLSAFSTFSFAQNAEEAPAYAPAVSPETEAWLEELASKAETREAEFAFVHCDDAMDFGDCREKYKEFVKRDPRFFGRILGYAAVRENNVSLCDSLVEKKEACRDVFDGLIVQRKFAESRCEELSGLAKVMCFHMSYCDQPADWQKNICQGLKRGDLSLIKKGQLSDGFCQETGDCEWDETDNIQALSTFQGFQANGNKKVCEQYLNGAHAYLCEVLFSESPINDVLDGVATDLAYYLLSEDRKAPFLCRNIKNNKLKAGCLSPDSDKYLKDTF